MKNAQDGFQQYQIVELPFSVTSTASTLDLSSYTSPSIKHVELVIKGPNKVYFRADGTTPTAGDAGNADVLPIEQPRFLPTPYVLNIKLICASTETASGICRLYL